MVSTNCCFRYWDLRNSDLFNEPRNLCDMRCQSKWLDWGIARQKSIRLPNGCSLMHFIKVSALSHFLCCSNECETFGYLKWAKNKKMLKFRCVRKVLAKVASCQLLKSWFEFKTNFSPSWNTFPAVINTLYQPTIIYYESRVLHTNYWRNWTLDGLRV